MPNSPYLAVPIQVEAWVVTKPMVDGHVDEKHPERVIKRWRNDYTPLQNWDSAFKWEEGGTKLNKPGVYVQWILPPCLRHGISQTNSSATNPDSTLTYPPLPNRWLITRLSGLNNAPAQAWIVESDAIVTDDYDSTTFPSKDEQGNPTTVLLGKQVALKDWLEPKDTQDRPVLNAVANGDIAFTVFQPYNQHVFSIYDALADIDPESSQASGTSLLLSYTVMGWYANPKQDPVCSLWENLQQKNPKKSKEDLLPMWLDALQKELHWPIQGIEKERNISVLPPQRKDELLALNQTISHGMVSGIPWQRDEQAPPSKQDNITLDKIKVVVGQTGLEALITWIQQHIPGVIPPDLLKAFEGCLLSSFGEELDAEEKLHAYQHQAGFGKYTGGIHWEVVNNPGATVSSPPNLAEFTSLLNQLNQKQEALEEAQRLYTMLQWHVYALWWKQNRASVILSDSSLSHTDKDLFEKIRDTLNKEFVSPSTTDSFLTIVKQSKTNVDALQKQYNDAYNELTSAVAKHKDQANKPCCILKQHVKPSFWHPADPVILMTNLQSPGLQKAPANFATRLSSQFADQITYTDPKTGSSKPPITWAGEAAQAPSLSLDNTSLPPVLVGLWHEAYLYDLLIRREVVAGQLDAENTKKLVDSIKALQGTTPVGLPSYGVGAWQQPWHPLFLEWETEWYPTKYTDWSFQEGVYRLQNIPETVPTSRKLRNRVVLTPQATIAFKGRLKQLVEHTKTLSPEQLEQIYQAIDNWDVLCQRLSGFHQTFCTYDNVPHRTPSEKDPLKPWINQEAHNAPYPGPYNQPTENWASASGFAPLRHGQFWLQTLRIIDRFGQSIFLNDLKPSSPSLSKSSSDNDITSLTTFTVSISPILIAEKPMLTSCDELSGNLDITKLLIQLAPRVVQDLRLRFDWIEANPPKQTPYLPLTTNAEINPICGWLLPNFLNQSLQVYDPQGLSLGELHLVNGDTDFHWEVSPYSACPDLATVEQKYPQLGAFLVGLKQASNSGYQAFREVIDNALYKTAVLPSRYARYLSALIGRPLALTRASWQLELAQPPCLDQGWYQTLAETSDASKDYSSLTNLKREARGEDPIFNPNAFDFSHTNYYATLGNPNLTQDGLVGYFIEKTSDLTQQYQSFYSAYDYDQTIKTTYIKLIKDNPLSLSLTKNARQITTLLLDPQAPIHAYTGILPEYAAELPARFIEPALHQMTVYFKLGPLLTLRYDLPLPASDKDTPSSLYLQKPGRGQNWAWHETANDGSFGPEWKLITPDTTARLETQPYELTEGCLVLKSMKEAPAAQSANNAPNTARSLSSSARVTTSRKSRYGLFNTSQPPLKETQTQEEEELILLRNRLAEIEKLIQQQGVTPKLEREYEIIASSISGLQEKQKEGTISAYLQ